MRHHRLAEFSLRRPHRRFRWKRTPWTLRSLTRPWQAESRGTSWFLRRRSTERAPDMVHACETPGCGIRTMGRFCFACEKEHGIEFPRFLRRSVRRAVDNARGDDDPERFDVLGVEPV